MGIACQNLQRNIGQNLYKYQVKEYADFKFTKSKVIDLSYLLIDKTDIHVEQFLINSGYKLANKLVVKTIYNLRLVDMEASLIQKKLRQIFPHQTENFNFLQFPGSLNQNISKIVGQQLPFLSVEQVHAMCKNQQQNVMKKLIEVKKMDIYQEMSKVCPNSCDLKDMPPQEITRKISHYSSKSTNQHSEHMSEFEEMELEQIDGIQQLQELDIDMLEMKAHPRELRNILDDEYLGDNAMWSDVGIYYFH